MTTHKKIVVLTTAFIPITVRLKYARNVKSKELHVYTYIIKKCTCTMFIIHVCTMYMYMYVMTCTCMYMYVNNLI